MEQRCETCRFWHEPLQHIDDDYFTGQCRRYPPIVYSIENEMQQARPFMPEYDFCGEWQQTATPKNDEYENILSKVAAKFGDKREQFAMIVSENLTKHPKEIGDLLKEAGVLKKSTYWRDVKILKDLE